MEAMANAYGLVVGISDYQHVGQLPPSVTKDARDVYTLLTDPDLGGYPRQNCRLILDGAVSAFRQALRELRPGDDGLAFIYFSGHGARVTAGPAAGEYLLLADTRVDEPASIATTAVSGRELSAALDDIGARRLLVIFDCCHAGGIGTLKGRPPGPGLSEAYYEALQAGRGRAIMASSRADEFSYVLPGDANSLFTRHLLDGLRGGAPGDDGLVRLFEVFEYLQPRVTASQPRQHPILKAHLEENFPVALRLGGRPAATPRDRDGYQYDAYISYVETEPDATWVWETLVPRLDAAGLRIAVSGDVDQPGVARVVGIQRGIERSRRTVVVLSPAYLDDQWAHFENVLAQTMGIVEGVDRLIPVRIAGLNDALPTRLNILVTLNFADPRRPEREWERLLNALREPISVRDPRP